MWWCCGKTNKDAPGCKFSKHFSKEDEDEDVDHHDENEIATNKNRYLKCYCCKESGHLAQDCPRDPNIKTQLDANEEDLRIVKSKNFRKVNFVINSFSFFQIL